MSGDERPMTGSSNPDATVFVVSGASLASAACREELEYAGSLNKRVIPVCIEEPAPGTEIQPALEALAWIMTRPVDDFEAGLDRLVRALDTDLTLARTHTRMLVRARAWEDGARDDDPLLRGEELVSATELARARCRRWWAAANRAAAGVHRGLA
jgi:hypothetical protein